MVPMHMQVLRRAQDDGKFKNKNAILRFAKDGGFFLRQRRVI